MVELKALFDYLSALNTGHSSGVINFEITRLWRSSCYSRLGIGRPNSVFLIHRAPSALLHTLAKRLSASPGRAAGGYVGIVLNTFPGIST